MPTPPTMSTSSNPVSGRKPATGNGTSHVAGGNGSSPQFAPAVVTSNGPIAENDKPIIYVNGKYVPKSQAMVSVYDHGLLYGDGVFEGIRIYNGKIFMCGQHMDRLWACAKAIRMEVPISREEMEHIQRECVRINNIRDGYIRLIVTRGAGTLGLDPRRCPRPGIICIADQIRLFAPELYKSGMRVVVAHRPKTPIECLDPRIKSLNYLNNILAKCEAIDFGCDEVIMLNLDGYVTEGSGDNIFIVKDGKVITPPSEAGILEGITRRFVLERLCKDTGVKCEERQLRLEDVLKADEAFLTGSAAEIIAVTQVDEHDGRGKIVKESRIGTGEGPVTKKLRDRFREIVTSDAVPED